MDSDCQLLHDLICVTCDCWQAITAFRVAYQLRREILVFQGLVEAYLSVGKVCLLPVLMSVYDNLVELSHCQAISMLLIFSLSRSLFAASSQSTMSLCCSLHLSCTHSAQLKLMI